MASFSAASTRMSGSSLTSQGKALFPGVDAETSITACPADGMGAKSPCSSYGNTPEELWGWPLCRAVVLSGCFDPLRHSMELGRVRLQVTGWDTRGGGNR